MRFKSGPLEGHSNTSILSSFSHSFTTFDVCLGSLSCWLAKRLPWRLLVPCSSLLRNSSSEGWMTSCLCLGSLSIVTFISHVLYIAHIMYTQGHLRYIVCLFLFLPRGLNKGTYYFIILSVATPNCTQDWVFGWWSKVFSKNMETILQLHYSIYFFKSSHHHHHAWQ